VRDFGDGRNVLHLEALRAGRFDEHRLRVRFEQFGDIGTDQRIVIRRLDAHALEHAVAEVAGRPVHAVGDQDVVAAACDRKQRGRNRRQSRRQQGDAGTTLAFERGERLFERFRGGGAAAAVLIARAVRHLILGGGIKHGRGVIDRRIDEAVLAFGIAAGGDQDGVRLERAFGSLRHGG
jgi:hypothetical protein